jgi:hypothetical protein
MNVGRRKDMGQRTRCDLICGFIAEEQTSNQRALVLCCLLQDAMENLKIGPSASHLTQRHSNSSKREARMPE